MAEGSTSACKTKRTGNARTRSLITASPLPSRRRHSPVKKSSSKDALELPNESSAASASPVKTQTRYTKPTASPAANPIIHSKQVHKPTNSSSRKPSLLQLDDQMQTPRAGSRQRVALATANEATDHPNHRLPTSPAIFYKDDHKNDDDVVSSNIPRQKSSVLPRRQRTTIPLSPVSTGAASHLAHQTLAVKKSNLYFDKQHKQSSRRHGDRLSRSRIQGTRGNGAISFCIDTDTPGGHGTRLTLVLGREIRTDDDDDGDSDNAASEEHLSLIPQSSSPSAFHDSNRGRSGDRRQHAKPTKSSLSLYQRSHNSLTEVFPQQRDITFPRDSTTLAESLENSLESVVEYRQLDNGQPSTGTAAYGSESEEESIDLQELAAATSEDESESHEGEGDDYEDNDVGMEETGDETSVSEEDDVDDHVKGYIHNYVRSKFQAPLPITTGKPINFRRQDIVFDDEDRSSDPMVGFSPRIDDDLKVELDSLADIQDSFAVASVGDYSVPSVPSVDYGYGEEVLQEQATASASSISAKELEPETLTPVLESPVAPDKETGLVAATRISSPLEFPASIARKSSHSEQFLHYSSKLRRQATSPRQPTHSGEESVNTDPRTRRSHDLGGGGHVSRKFRGSKKPTATSRLRQPSMAGQTQSDHDAKSPSSATNLRPRFHSSAGSGVILQHSHTSMGSSGSDSSALCNASNPYTMPESVLNQSMAFMQFDFRAEAGVTRCETNEDVQVAESSEDGSIDEFNADQVHESCCLGDMPELEPLKMSDVSNQRAPPRLPARNKSNEDMSTHVSMPQRGIRGLVRNHSNRDAFGASMGAEGMASAATGRSNLTRSLSSDCPSLTPKRGIMRNFSNRAGRSTSSERGEEVKRPGLFRVPKTPADTAKTDKEGSKDIMKKLFSFGNASISNMTMGNRSGEVEKERFVEDTSMPF